VKKWRK